MNENLPTVSQTGVAVVRGDALTKEQLALVKRTIMPDGATDQELDLFLAVAQSTRLNPFAKEIYAAKIDGRLVVMPGIDGLRRKAAESGDYAGQVGPYWCGPDGNWKDVWLSETPPAACKVGVLRKGATEPTWAVVTWTEFNRRYLESRKRGNWTDRPAHMLAIVAERHALRKAVPRIDEQLRQQGADADLDAEMLVANAERLERQTALPETGGVEPIFPEDDEVEGEATVVQDEADDKTTATAWSKTDRQRMADYMMNAELSPREVRRLLGLDEDAPVEEIMALGSVGEVMDKVDAGLAAISTPRQRSF